MKERNKTMANKIGDFFSGALYSEKKDIKAKRKRTVYKKLPDFNPDNTQVFMDIAIGHHN